MSEGGREAFATHYLWYIPIIGMYQKKNKTPYIRCLVLLSPLAFFLYIRYNLLVSIHTIGGGDRHVDNFER